MFYDTLLSFLGSLELLIPYICIKKRFSVSPHSKHISVTSSVGLIFQQIHLKSFVLMFFWWICPTVDLISDSETERPARRLNGK